MSVGVLVPHGCRTDHGNGGLMGEIRKRAIRRWSCPNHPDGPPTLPADGYEREELTLEQAYPADVVEALRRLTATGGIDGELVAEAFGVCCLGGSWRTVGYETIEVSPYVVAMEQMIRPMKFPPLVLLAELARGRIDGESVRIPIVRSDREDGA